MLSEDDKAEVRRILRDEIAELRGLPDSEIEFPEGQIDATKAEHVVWEPAGKVKDFAVWLGRSRGGKIIKVLVTAIGLASTFDWGYSHLVKPSSPYVQAAYQQLSEFLTPQSTFHGFSQGDGNRLMLVSNDDRPHHHIFYVHEGSGILSPEMFGNSIPVTASDNIGLTDRVNVAVFSPPPQPPSGVA